jgi:hypothetical protein
MNDLKNAIEFETESSNFFNEFVKRGTRAGSRRHYPINRTVVSKIENSGATNGVSVVLLDMEQGEFQRH